MIPELPPAGSNLTPAMSWACSGTLAAGTIVDEHFEILSAIGRGGMSVVYRANDRRLDRVVALKMLNSNMVKDDGALKRFQREAVAVGTLSHPNIINVFGFGQWHSQPYVVMELLEGQSLSEFAEGEEKPSSEQLVKLFLQILEGLGYAHARGIIHRDLKPRNIMLTNSNTAVKIVDFGIAKILPESGKEIQKLTQTGELFGTVGYMSPEQCMGLPFDARSDIYSMGCLMYECLSGRPPFEGSSGYAVMAKHLDGQITELPCDDQALSNVVLWALEKDPDKRPQSAEELARVLRNPKAWKPSAVKRKICVHRLPFAIAVTALVASVGVAWVCTHPHALKNGAAVATADLSSNTTSDTVIDDVNRLMKDGQMAAATRVMQQNEKVFTRTKALECRYYSLLALLYYKQGFWSLSVKMSDQAINAGGDIRARSEHGFSMDLTMALTIQVESLIRLGRVDEALPRARTLIRYLRESGTPSIRYDMTGYLSAIGNEFLRAGREDLAKEFKDAAEAGKEYAK